MKYLKTLILLQMKDKLDFSFLKSKRKTISKVIFTILGYILLCGVFFALFYLASFLKLFSLTKQIPLSVIVIIITCVFTLNLLSCTYKVMKKLYFSTDNPVLLTLPVKPNMVFVSKLIVFYIYELIKNVYSILPILIGFGIFAGYPIYFYPWLIFAILVITILQVLISALLSLPLMFIYQFLRNYNTLRIALFSILIGVVVFAVIKIIAIIPQDINIIENWGTIFWSVQDFINQFVIYAYPFAKMVRFLCGSESGFGYTLFSKQTFVILAILIGLILVSYVLIYYISRPLFFKMASKPFEHKNKIITKAGKNKQNKSIKSGVILSLKQSFRTPEFVYNYVGILFVLPLSILLLNKIYNAMNTKLLGLYMTLSFNILLILLILLTSNIIISSIFSKEGRSSYYFKTMPKQYITILMPKLMFSSTISLLSVVVTSIIFGYYAKLGTLNSVLCSIFIYALYVAHLFWSAELDIMNPQNEQYATSGIVENNPNEKKSTILAFVLSFLFFVISLLLFMENLSVAWIKLAGITLIFAIYRVVMFVQKVKLFYKEK